MGGQGHLTIPAAVPPLDISHRLIGRFVIDLHYLRPNCRHWRRTVNVHFSQHSCSSSSDFNSRLVKDMQRCVRFCRCACCCTD